MKKFLSALFAVCICSSFWTSNTFADDELTIRVGEVKGLPGSSVQVPISIENNPGFDSTRLTVSYDNTKLTLTDFINTGSDVLFGRGLGAKNPSVGMVNFAGSNSIADDGVLAIAVFTIKDTVTPDADPIPVSVTATKLTGPVYVAGGIKCICETHSWDDDDGVITTLPAITTEGERTSTCTVCSETKTAQLNKLGDINGDGYVDTDDALLLLQADVGSITLTRDQKAVANLSGLGNFDTDDAVLILRYDVQLIDDFPDYKNPEVEDEITPEE